MSALLLVDKEWWGEVRKEPLRKIGAAELAC
jgi:hypothetical protein